MIKQSDYTVKLHITGENYAETKAAADWATETYGGCHILNGRGYWKDNTGEVHIETVNLVIIHIFANNFGRTSVISRVNGYMLGYMERTNQKAVMYEIGDEARLIELEKEIEDVAS